MELKVVPGSGIPLYLQIYMEIRKAIMLGRLKPGDRLPNVRDLALRLVVNIHTVRRAYELLEGEGLVESRPGRGTFVVSVPKPSKEEVVKAAGELVALAKAGGENLEGLLNLIRSLWEGGEGCGCH